MRTRLYLDIDGVINALSPNFRVPPVKVAGYPIRMDTALVRQFIALFDEVVWATTWVLHPPALDEMERFIGVEGLRVIDTTRTELDSGMWGYSTGKAPAVARHFDADPLEVGATLWMDDMLGDLDFAISQPRGIITHKPNDFTGAYPFITQYVDDGRTWSQHVQENISVR